MADVEPVLTMYQTSVGGDDDYDTSSADFGNEDVGATFGGGDDAPSWQFGLQVATALVLTMILIVILVRVSAPPPPPPPPRRRSGSYRGAPPPYRGGAPPPYRGH